MERRVFRELIEVLAASRQELRTLPPGRVSDEWLENLDHQLSRFDSLLERIADVQKERLGLHLISQIALSLATALDIDEVVNEIIDSLKQVVDYDAAGIFLVSPDGKTVEGEWLRGYESCDPGKIRQKFGQGLVGWAIANRESVLVEDVTADKRYINARPLTKSELVVPMYSGDNVIGCFNLESDHADAFDKRDTDHFSTFASHAAVAIERARLHKEIIEKHRLDEELALARRMQRDLLPKRAPRLERFDIAGVNVPTEAVGGDYFDYIPLTDKDLGIVVSDVAGKGVPAAFIMASLRAALRIEAFSRYAISSILSKVNDFLNESTKPEIFVTAFYGVLDVMDGILTYANAGHNPPILFRTEGDCEYLTEGGMLLGAFPGALYHEHRIRFNARDILILYTDGATEAENRAGDQFGVDKLEEVVRRAVAESPREIVRRLLKAIRKHTGSPGLQDDITLMVIKCR